MVTILSRRALVSGAAFAAASMCSRLGLAATAEMIETEDDIEGPFYKAGAPKRASLVEKDMPGTHFELSGRVFNTQGKAVPGAVLDVWQASHAGEYDNTGYTLRGVVQADENGIYKLNTILPKHYKIGPNTFRPAHIHFKLRGDSCRELTTQLYFKGDPYNKVDAYARPSLMLRPTDKGAGKQAKFDFILKAI